MKDMNRRKAIKIGLGTLGASVLGAKAIGATLQTCGILSPEQTEGPFYPNQLPSDSDADLTRIKGKSGTAKGEHIFIKGVVRDPNCQPVEDAVVEIWQTNADGRYHHPGDRNNPASIDPNFQGFGQTVTNAMGEFLFKTVMPKAYPASNTWIRPPHVHFKVHKVGSFETLTTQMYFEGDKYNSRDLILQRIPQPERSSVIVEFKNRVTGFPKEKRVGHFVITLNPIGGL